MVNWIFERLKRMTILDFIILALCCLFFPWVLLFIIAGCSGLWFLRKFQKRGAERYYQKCNCGDCPVCWKRQAKK